MISWAQSIELVSISGLQNQHKAGFKPNTKASAEDERYENPHTRQLAPMAVRNVTPRVREISVLPK
jgi:hypothetical protein